jgi:hypothetical protein
VIDNELIGDKYRSDNTIGHRVLLYRWELQPNRTDDVLLMGAVRSAITDVDWAVRELIDAEVRYEETKDVWERRKEQLPAIDVQNSGLPRFLGALAHFEEANDD